jgi:hypothetical protein
VQLSPDQLHMPYHHGVVGTESVGGIWSRCLLGMTLLVVNDGRCPTFG